MELEALFAFNDVGFKAAAVATSETIKISIAKHRIRQTRVCNMYRGLSFAFPAF